ATGTYSVEAVRALDTHRTPIQKQPEILQCLVGISRKYYLGDEVASDQGTATLEVSPSGDVPAATALEPSQIGAAADPLAATESRKRGHDGTDANAPPKSSPGIAAARDPESKNASSPAEVGSPGGVYRPEWGVINGSLLDTPEACQDMVDHVAPPG
nr:hypothetical protein [Tanacetum cinerariifolium]